MRTRTMSLEDLSHQLGGLSEESQVSVAWVQDTATWGMVLETSFFMFDLRLILDDFDTYCIIYVYNIYIHMYIYVYLCVYIYIHILYINKYVYV